MRTKDRTGDFSTGEDPRRTLLTQRLAEVSAGDRKTERLQC
jgi:hypothetical protein